MSTSGSIDLNLTAREIVTFALKKLRVLDAGRTAGAIEAATAQLELNLLLKDWQKYQNLWRLTEGSITLTTANSYTLSPMPHKVVSARYISTGGNALPMDEMLRGEYFDLPNKTGTGSPHSYYVDYQRASAIMYIWQPLASVTTETIPYTYQRKFEDIDSLDNDIDVKQEWLKTLGYNLATALGPNYGRCDSRSYAKIESEAERLLREMQDDDREEEVRMEPFYAGAGW